MEDSDHEIETNSEFDKAKHVLNQKVLWNNLLDIRVQLQGIVSAANNLPEYEEFNEYIEKHDKDTLKESLKTRTDTVCGLLNSFLHLQQSLSSNNSEFKKILASEEKSKKRSRENYEKGTQWMDGLDLDDIYEKINEGQEVYMNTINNVIEKWGSKVLYVSNLNTSKFKSINQSIPKQVEDIMKDREKILKKTQLNRSQVTPLTLKGESEENRIAAYEASERKPLDSNFNEEIFDDSDFFQQMLKEFLETGMSETNDSIEMTRQFLALRALQSKVKKNVDRKASKGRKLRYAEHEKLVSFMAPMYRKYKGTETFMASQLLKSIFGQQPTPASDDEDEGVLSDEEVNEMDEKSIQSEDHESNDEESE